MTDKNIGNIRNIAIPQIKEKVKKNPKYLHPCNKERKNDECILGFSGYEYTCWLQQIGVMKHPTEDYKDSLAKKKGYENYNEYQRKELSKYKIDWNRNNRHEKGIQIPMELNKDCASNFGIVVGEELFKIFLERSIFEQVEKTGYKDNGIDFFCKNPRQDFIDKYQQFNLRKDKEYRIQSKMRCLIDHNGSIQWVFSIEYNKVSDYFILCGWNTREGEPLHIWFIHRDEIIGDRKLFDRESLTITNIQKTLTKFKKYDLTSELNVLKEIYNEYK